MYEIPAHSSPLSSNYPQEMLLLEEGLLIVTTSSLFMFDKTTTHIKVEYFHQNLGMAGVMDTCTVNKVRSATKDLIIVSPLGTDRIYIYSISSAKFSEVQLSGKTVLDIDVNRHTGDVVALVRLLPDKKEADSGAQPSVQLQILVEEKGTLVTDDHFEVSSDARTVSFIAGENYVLVEGKSYVIKVISFSVLSA